MTPSNACVHHSVSEIPTGSSYDHARAVKDTLDIWLQHTKALELSRKPFIENFTLFASTHGDFQCKWLQKANMVEPKKM